MADIQMISPPVYVFHDGAHVPVFGWYIQGAQDHACHTQIVPIVSNPDGPGVAPWPVYYGEDPWTTS